MVCHPSVGGSGILATSLGMELARRGHEIHFISHEWPFHLPPDEPRTRFHRVDVSAYGLFKYPDYVLPLSVKMAEVGAEHRLDVLHLHYAVPHATAAVLALAMLEPSKRPKVVTTLHGTDVTLLGHDPAYAPAIRHALNVSDAVTAVSHFLREEAERAFNMTRPIETIPNFYVPRTPRLSREKVRRDLGVGDDETLLLHASNLRPVKRIDVLLEAVSLLASEQRFRLLVLAGETFAPFEADAFRLGIEDRILVRERVRDVEEYYQAADFNLVTSDSESFCLSILEAMFFGSPSVATRVGGIPEVIANDEIGILVPPGDARALATGIGTLMEDSERRRAMGRAAKRFAEDHYAGATIVPRYEALYRRVCGLREAS